MHPKPFSRQLSSLFKRHYSPAVESPKIFAAFSLSQGQAAALFSSFQHVCFSIGSGVHLFKVLEPNLKSVELKKNSVCAGTENILKVLIVSRHGADGTPIMVLSQV